MELYRQRNVRLSVLAGLIVICMVAYFASVDIENEANMKHVFRNEVTNVHFTSLKKMIPGNTKGGSYVPPEKLPIPLPDELPLPHPHIDPSKDPVALQIVLRAHEECESICLKLKSNHAYNASAWENGPCFGKALKDPRLGSSEPWGCDIAHCPRTKVDEDPKNQCHKVNRWIELDTECSWLRYRFGKDQPRQGVYCSADGTTKQLQATKFDPR